LQRIPDDGAQPIERGSPDGETRVDRDRQGAAGERCGRGTHAAGEENAPHARVLRA